MKRFYIFLVLCALAFTAAGQQKPVYERSRTNQVLSDYATWSKYFMGVPHGDAAPSFPSFVPDSVKNGAIYLRTGLTQPGYYVYNNGVWVKYAPAVDGGYLPISGGTLLGDVIQSAEPLTARSLIYRGFINFQDYNSWAINRGLGLKAINSGIIYIGDSNLEGYNSTGVGDNNWATILTKNLQKNQGLQSGVAFTNFSDPTRYGISITGTTSIVSTGPSNTALQMTPGSVITFTAAANLVEFWFNANTSGGSIILAYNGTPYKTIACNLINANNQSSFNGPANVTPSGNSGTYTLTCTGGNVVITALFKNILFSQGYDTNYFIREAVAGTTFGDFNLTNIAATTGLVPTSYGANNLYLVALGTNSIYNPSKATSSNQLKADLINWFKTLNVGGNKMVYIIPPRTLETSYPPVLEPYSNYRTKILRVCDSLSIPYIDLEKAKLSISDFEPDGLHYSTPGQLSISAFNTNNLAKLDLSNNIGSKADSARLYTTVLPQYAKTDSLVKYGVDVTKWGFKADSLLADTTINSNALDSALAYAAKSKKYKRVILPAGYAFMKRQTYVPAGVDVEGLGSAKSTLDYSFASKNNFSSGAAVNIYGSEYKMGNLAAIVRKGDTTITVNTPVTLKEGDVIRIIDTVGYSFNKARQSYREGEMFMVRKAVNNATLIKLDHPSRGYYGNLNSAEVYFMNMSQNAFKGFTIKAHSFAGLNGLVINRAKNVKVEDIRVFNSGDSGLQLLYCYGFDLRQINASKSSQVVELPITSYGISINASQNGGVYNSYAYATRHGLTFGGNFPNRDVRVDGNTFASGDGAPSFDMHGPCEKLIVTNNNILNGAVLAGKNNVFSNNLVDLARSISGLGPVISLSLREVCGIDWMISNNTINGVFTTNNTETAAVSWNILDWGQANAVDTVGTFTFTNNKVNWNNTAANSTNYVIRVRIETGNTLGDMPLKFVFKDNEFRSRKGATVETRVQIDGFDPTHRLKSLEFTNNILDSAGLYARRFIGDLKIESNTIKNTRWASVHAIATNIYLLNNTFTNYCIGTSSGAGAGSYSAYRTTSATNLWINGNIGITTGSPTNGAYIDNVTTVTRGLEKVQGTENFTNVTNNLGFSVPNLTVRGLIQPPTSVQTANYSTTSTDIIIPTNSTAGNFNVTLLSTAIAGQTYYIDNSVATANAVTIVGTINGATNYTLNSTKYVVLYKTATGTNTWRIIGNN